MAVVVAANKPREGSSVVVLNHVIKLNRYHDYVFNLIFCPNEVERGSDNRLGGREGGKVVGSPTDQLWDMFSKSVRIIEQLPSRGVTIPKQRPAC